MSQDDQRDQPNEEPDARESDVSRNAREMAAGAGDTAGGAAGSTTSATAPDVAAAAGDAGSTTGSTTPATAREVAAAAGDVGSTTGGTTPATADTATEAAATTATAEAAATTTAARPAATPRREFHDPGEGAPRYAATPDQAPRSGSEESWSAAPNPGFERDPAINYPAKRVLAGTLIGALLMAGFVAYAARILTNRSGNGNGSAAWTAAYERDGAVLGGINAQNDGSAHEIAIPADTTFGDSGSANGAAIDAAASRCRTATATAVPVTTATGTTASIGDWAVHATPSVQRLRTDAATLQTALSLGHVAAVANAANTLCSGYPAIAALQAMPDAAGSQAWSSAASAFATAATESLRGASGNPDATAAAFDNLALGNKQLEVLASRITAAT
jgi:hypothetical protein